VVDAIEVDLRHRVRPGDQTHAVQENPWRKTANDQLVIARDHAAALVRGDASDETQRLVDRLNVAARQLGAVDHVMLWGVSISGVFGLGPGGGATGLQAGDLDALDGVRIASPTAHRRG